VIRCVAKASTEGGEEYTLDGYTLRIAIQKYDSRFVILSEAAAGAKDLYFKNGRCFALAQHDKLERILQ
jgi:hypothetical protein